MGLPVRCEFKPQSKAHVVSFSKTTLIGQYLRGGVAVVSTSHSLSVDTCQFEDSGCFQEQIRACFNNVYS